MTGDTAYFLPDSATSWTTNLCWNWHEWSLLAVSSRWAAGSCVWLRQPAANWAKKFSVTASTATKCKKVLQLGAVLRLKYFENCLQVGSVSFVRCTYSIYLSVHQRAAHNKTSTLTKFFPFKSHAFLFFFLRMPSVFQSPDAASTV